MITVRRSAERGGANHGWLDTKHTFSFADYHDPAHMGFRDLRVLNEDRVTPGEGFPTHSHRDMEILSWVLAGELEHRDSMGNGSVIRPGELQRMSAGTGVRHSERNPSGQKPLHFLQIWIFPERNGLAPSYEQKEFPEAERRGRLRVIASPDGRDGSVTIHQDVSLSTALLDGAEKASIDVRPGRSAWVQVARGSLDLNGRRLESGDGAAVSREERLELANGKNAEVLVFDLR
ncbi:MAG TPA: pirin family protein [Thermoanaerobaculia bacterium]|nr:pirin family protein [Thermoanaerobaculia bacterium]